MKNAGGVRGLERAHDRIEDLGHAFEREPLAPLLESEQVIVEVGPDQQLHHQTELAVDASADVEQLYRGGALERAQALAAPRIKRSTI